MQLSSFQKKCKEELFRNLELIGETIQDIKIAESDEKWFAKKEVFIEVTLKKLKLWIYEDGAHIRSAGINKPFEIQDYHSEDDLIKKFVEKVKIVISVNDGVRS